LERANLERSKAEKSKRPPESEKGVLERGREPKAKGLDARDLGTVRAV